jgi:hypothetical protein
MYAKTLMFSFNLCCLNFSPQLKLYTKAVACLPAEEVSAFIHEMNVFSRIVGTFVNNFANCFERTTITNNNKKKKNDKTRR